MKKRKIRLARILVQIFCIVTLIYGHYFLKNIYIGRPITDDGMPTGKVILNQFGKGSILWVSGDKPVIEAYLPTLACRFTPNNGMFKSCILHMLSENITWRTPIMRLLPYIALFVILSFLFGRLWCGWVCPMGTVGDFLTWLRRKMYIPVRRFSSKFRNSLHYSSYGFLGTSLGISAFISLPFCVASRVFWFVPYCQICPSRLICPTLGLIRPTWRDFTPTITSVFTVLSWVMLGLFVSAFFWGRRIWCHLCPVGRINSWFNRGAVFKLKKKAIKCNKCGSCADACPMGLTKVYEADKDIVYNKNDCIMCLRCIEACPRNGCLTMHFFGKKIVESRY